MSRAVSVLDRSLYVHQWNYSGKWATREQFLERVSSLGFTGLALKALDGVNWMSEFDTVNDRATGEPVPHPWSIGGPADLEEWQQLAAPYGVWVRPWVNARGLNPAAELSRWLSLRGPDRNDLELDLEPYDGFWAGSAGDLVDMVGQLYRAGARVIVDAHISKYTVQALPFPSLVPFVELWLGQSYWTTFQRDAVEVIHAEADYWAAIGASDWGAIFPAGGERDFQRAADAVAERDGSEIGYWQLGSSSKRSLESFAAVA